MSAPSPYARSRVPLARGGDGLADILERVLDRGLVIAGDIQVNLLDIELLTIKVRLLLASADTAQQMGIDWWRHDPFLSGRDHDLASENAVLRRRVERLEALVAGDRGRDGAHGDGEAHGDGADGDSTAWREATATGGSDR